MKELTVYGFENIDGEPDQFTTIDYNEAVEYAKRWELKMIEHTYEWQDQTQVTGHDYTTVGGRVEAGT